MRRDSWLPLMNDDDHVNVLIPIMALAYEHHPDPKMRPYKEPMSIERREQLIVGVAASVRRSTATFPGAENLKLKSSHLLEPFDAMPRNLAATSHVHADQGRSSSTAVPRQRSIDVCLAARPELILDASGVPIPGRGFLGHPSSLSGGIAWATVASAFPHRELGGLADVADSQRESVTTKDLQLGCRINAGHNHLPAECEDRGVTVGGDVSGGAGIDAGTGKLDADDVHGCVPDIRS